ncbi:MAG: photosynthetic reaction center cytochrome c subunit [Acidobacteria bacterium]|nr:photosynthetic reaction center cytochrome c subunit [Acidobacteriota bacterium]
MNRVLLVLGIACLSGIAARAQAPAAPPPMRNLQVWPKDTPREQVVQTMRAFNESLGVECNYCHVADLASDEKREKRVARQMILLRDAINVMLAAIVDKPAGAGPTAGTGQPGAPIRVLCRDCHHGLPIPKQLTTLMTEAEGSGGAAAGLARYRELRAQFYGGQQYDFTENSLLTMAQRALAAKRPQDAMQYLQANLEYFPQSVRSKAAMSEAQNQLKQLNSR